MSLMDRPVDGVTAVNVTISEMWIKPRGDGPAVQLAMTSTPLTVNLLELNDGNASVLVDQAIVDAVPYNWVEMKVEDTLINEAYVMTTAGEMKDVDIDVPSDKIRLLVGGFDVAANQGVRFLFDWDVRKGLTEAVGRDVYMLRPVFRVLNVDEYGSISGKISADTIAQDANCNRDGVDLAEGKVVYIFAGNVTPDDYDVFEPEPVTTVDAILDVTTSDYRYRAVVMPGDYTVAFTCLGDMDEDNRDDDLAFLGPKAEGFAERYPDGVISVTAAEPVENVDF
jgi:hypothetical protein